MYMNESQFLYLKLLKLKPSLYPFWTSSNHLYVMRDKNAMRLIQ